MMAVHIGWLLHCFYSAKFSHTPLPNLTACSTKLVQSAARLNATHCRRQ